MAQLFDEYIACGGDWLQSSIVLSSKRTNSNQILGDNKYFTFKDLKEKYGEETAKVIRSEKKKLEQTPPNAELPWWKPHPDVDVED